MKHVKHALRLLLVEDNPRDVRLLEEALLKDRVAGFRMTCVQTLAETLKALEHPEVDVVLLDLFLPDSQGLDTVKAVHRLAPSIPVVVLTGSDDEDLAVQALHEGAQDYLPKGYVTVYRNLLGRSVRYAVERQRMLKQIQDGEELQKAMAEDQRHRVEELDSACRQLERTQAMLIQAEKMSAVGQLASGIAHEVKNPLSIILQGINYLEREIGPGKPQWSQVLDMMREAVRRSDRIIRGLLDFSKPARLEVAPSSVERVVEASLELVEKQLAVTNIRVVKDIAAGLPKVALDENQMKQVFINLILNAFQAMRQGGQLTIRVQTRVLGEVGQRVGTRTTDVFQLGEPVLECQIADTGPGIARDAVPKVFDPFYTTKPPGQGTGLGLAITRAIVEAHRGLILLDSEPGQGTLVTVMLPIASAAASRPGRAEPDAQVAQQARVYAEEIPGS
jgi:signal transduction histidine kinase